MARTMVDEQPYLRHHVFVEVLDDYLWIAEDESGELWFPVRPSCNALEIDSPTAIATIKEDSRLVDGLREIKLPSAGGDQTQQCLRSDEYAWWLALFDPRRFKDPVKRQRLQERQRILMRLAKDIMLQRQNLRPLIKQDTSPQRPAKWSGTATSHGQMEGSFDCLSCGAPHFFVIDGNGWHLYLGVRTTD
jgi:hypothetical protein